MNLADVVHLWDADGIDDPDEIAESKRTAHGLLRKLPWLDRPVGWFLELERENRVAYVEELFQTWNSDEPSADFDDSQTASLLDYIDGIGRPARHEAPAGDGMRLVDAYCRARAVIDGCYLEVDGYRDDMSHAEYSQMVADTPCPYPENDGYPLPPNWESDHPFLKNWYAWFLYDLGQEAQVAYIEKLVGSTAIEAVDIVNTMLTYVADTDVGATTTSSTGRDGPVRVHRDPGKNLLSYLAGKGAPVPARFVADVLLLHCNAKTGHTWPSISTIEGYTGFGRRTVQRAISWLIDEKVIREVKPFQHGGDRYASRVFEFTSKVPL